MRVHQLQVLLAGIEARLAKPLADQLQRLYGYATHVDTISRNDLATLTHTLVHYDVAVVQDSEQEVVDHLRTYYPDIPWVTMVNHHEEDSQAALPTTKELDLLTSTASSVAAEIVQTLTRSHRHSPEQHDDLLIAFPAAQSEGLSGWRGFLNAVRSLRDADDVFAATCRLAVAFFQVDHSGFARFDLDYGSGYVIAEYPAIGTLGLQIPSRGVVAEERLIDSKQPLCIDRIATASDLGSVGAILGRFNIRSTLIVPVVYQNRVLGSFSLDVIGCERKFTDDEIDLAMILAHEIATTLERTSLLQQTQHVERFKQLSSIGGELLGALEIDQVLTLIADHIVRLVGARRSLFLFVDMLNHVVIKATGSGFPPGTLGQITFEEVESGVSGWVLASREAVLVENAQIDPRNTRQALAKAKALSTGSLIVVPLLNNDRVLGTLTAINEFGDPVFTRDDLDLVVMLARQATLAICNTLAYQETVRRQRMLSELDEASRHLRAEKGWHELQQEIARLGTHLAGALCGGLAINYPRVNAVQIQAVYQLPPELLGTMLQHGEGLIGLVAQQGTARYENAYATWSERESRLAEYPIAALAAIPIKYVGETEAVLFVCHRDGANFSATDSDILERFAMQAGLALHTTYLLTPMQRRLSSLAILHQISDYIQLTDDLDKILRAVLTGITAGYGLGFNRAVVLLLNRQARRLEGRAGVGELTLMATLENWRKHAERGLEDFLHFVAHLDSGQMEETPLGARIREIDIPCDPGDQSLSQAGPILLQVMDSRQPALVDTEQLDQLPAAFSAIFEPISPVVVVPLVVRAEAIGMLVADDKFSGTPITPERVEALMTFANTAAVALDNWHLLQETIDARSHLRSFYAASSALVSSNDPDRLPREIVERARRAARADGVTMILIDANGWVEELIATGEDQHVTEEDVIRPNGISMHVVRTMRPVRIGDAIRQQSEVNPHMIERMIRAALCLPIVLEGTCMGVIWIHFHQPRQFLDAEVDAAQLYVNQAAIAYDSARRMKRLERMRRAAEALSGASGLPAVLNQIGTSACEVFQAGSAMILAYDSDRKQFIPGRSEVVGVPRELWSVYQKEEPRRGGTAYKILNLGYVNVHNLDEISNFPFIGTSTQEFLHVIGARSFEGVRLSVGEESIGVLYINYHRPHSFHADDVKAVLTFANHAALALKNAQLLDQVNRAHEGARAIADVMALEGDLSSTLKAVVDATFDVLGCDAVTIYVYDETKDRLYYPPIMCGIIHTSLVTKYEQVPPTSIVYTMLRCSEPYIADTVKDDRVFGGTRFAQDEGIRSCVAVPLQVRQEKVGVAFVNYRVLHRFTKEEQDQIKLFANQAAVAIRNAHLSEERQRRLSALQALHRAGQFVTRSLALDETLNQIIKEGLALIGEGEGTYCSSHLALVDEASQQLRFTAAYPPHSLAELQSAIGPIDLLAPEQIGITGRAVRTGQSQNVPDVSRDPDYIPHTPNVRSELAVPIKDGERVIGSINMKHPQLNAFTQEDMWALETLADYAATAILNAELYTRVRNQLSELQQTKKMLDAQTAVAWMGIVSATWRHANTASASSIHDLVTLIESNLRAGGPPDKLLGHLSQIKSLVERIQNAPITGPLATEKSTGFVPINRLLRERMARRTVLDGTIEYVPEWHLDDSAAVLGDFQWLRQAFDLLIDNAIEAIADAPTRRITIITRPCDDGVEVLIRDTGCGIPEYIRSQIFRTQIEKPSGSRGMGMGLLIAQTIVHAYGGEIAIGTTGRDGTTMCVKLPQKPSPYEYSQDGGTI